jgi:hypothetical protein
MYDTLQVEREGHCTWVTLARPDALREGVLAFIEKRPARFRDA